tara:strand:- start:909 stop:1196 length:288 start_codon:yes stop_codon:yes gene_type:complete
MKKNFTRKDLAHKVYQNLGFSKNISSQLVDNFFDYLVDDLVKLNKTKITSFGTFEVRSKKERQGRNPKTKVVAKISARKIVKFKPSILIKEKVNN